MKGFIMNRLRRFFVLLCVGCIFSVHLYAVDNAKKVELVDVCKINAHILRDVRYATKNNFVGESVYPSAKCYLQKPAAVALGAVEVELEQLGLKLKVYDAYRPRYVQELFWEKVAKLFPDPAVREQYVANPAKGSKHNRGTAVDVTLVDASTGEELAMPSGYDDFSEKAHRSYADMPTDHIRRNCKLLELVMLKHGFIGISSEWWHFDWKDWEGYPILNVKFEDLH